jgi:hypothetical protein
MLLGVVVFLVITGLGRANPATGAARSLVLGPRMPSRYLYMVAALMLPALALAADAVVRRWRVLGPAVLTLFVIGIPGNLQQLAQFGGNEAWRDYRQAILSLPRLPVAHQVPRSERVPRSFFPPATLTIGWLLDGVASGRVPPPGPIDPTDAATLTLRLALHQSRPPTSNACEDLPEPAIRRLDKGQSIGIDGGAVRVSYVPEGSHESRPILVNPGYGRTLVALAGPLNLRLSSNNPAMPAVLCDGDGTGDHQRTVGSTERPQQQHSQATANPTPQ